MRVTFHRSHTKLYPGLKVECSRRHRNRKDGVRIHFNDHLGDVPRGKHAREVLADHQLTARVAIETFQDGAFTIWYLIRIGPALVVIADAKLEERPIWQLVRGAINCTLFRPYHDLLLIVIPHRNGQRNNDKLSKEEGPALVLFLFRYPTVFDQPIHVGNLELGCSLDAPLSNQIIPVVSGKQLPQIDDS